MGDKTGLARNDGAQEREAGGVEAEAAVDHVRGGPANGREDEDRPTFESERRMREGAEAKRWQERAAMRSRGGICGFLQRA